MIWKKTPLSKFGFKCVMNKHGVCAYSVCECLCHEGIFDLSLNENKDSIAVT